MPSSASWGSLVRLQSVIGLDYSEGLLDDDDDQAKAATGSQPPEKGVPHRWQIVFMMAAAFVLCNMDKVSSSLLLYWTSHMSETMNSVTSDAILS